MPFRWHRSTTSLKTRATSLSFHLCYSGQDAERHSIAGNKSCLSHFRKGLMVLWVSVCPFAWKSLEVQGAAPPQEV